MNWIPRGVWSGTLSSCNCGDVQSALNRGARHLLIRAEALAELLPVERGGFHSYRRLFAVEWKHEPDVDVMRAGGRRDLAMMKGSYQQSDPSRRCA